MVAQVCSFMFIRRTGFEWADGVYPVLYFSTYYLEPWVVEIRKFDHIHVVRMDAALNATWNYR